MWQPAWGIRTALIGVQAFMAARAEAAVGIGSLDYPLEEREKLANRYVDERPFLLAYKIHTGQETGSVQSAKNRTERYSQKGTLYDLMKSFPTV